MDADLEAETKCWCIKCRPITVTDMRMVVCPTCGDKRCIHALNHDAPCAKDDLYAHNIWVEDLVLGNAMVVDSPILLAVEADFEEMTWTFQLTSETRVGPGRYAIVYVGPNAEVSGAVRRPLD